jgi:hypothetical protein
MSEPWEARGAGAYEGKQACRRFCSALRGFLRAAACARRGVDFSLKDDLPPSAWNGQDIDLRLGKADVDLQGGAFAE